jgi:hypothetical protein
LLRELKENPEFFKAFPHLQEPIYQANYPETPGQSYLEDEHIKTQDYFDTEDFKSKSTQEKAYFKSLLDQHNKYLSLDKQEHVDKEEYIRENELSYIQGYQTPTGPLKYMSADAKEKVHREIDERM